MTTATGLRVETRYRWAQYSESRRSGGLESNLQRHEDLVRYMESCGRGLLPAVAVRFGRRRLPASLHSVDLVDDRNIPKPAVEGSLVSRPSRAPHHVRYPEYYSRFRAGLMYSRLSHA